MFTYSTFYLTGFCFFSCSAWLCGLLSDGSQEVRKCFFVRIHRCFFMMEALMRTVPNCIQTIPDRLGIRFPGIGNRIPDCWEQTSHAPVLTVSVVCCGARARISQGQAIVRMLGTGYGMYFQTGKNHQKRMISLHLTHPHLLG